MAGKRAKKGANGYKLPEAIAAGEILTDLSKKQWIIGQSIGVGGFGEIYSAASYSGKNPKDYPNVIKIEPHGNGPLFVEMHFYMRNAKYEDIQIWKKKKKLNHLGMPHFISSGSHEYKDTKYRFLVMERFGTDLWKLFLNNNRQFSNETVYKIAIQVIDVLEYIHSKNYVHADIKGANLLLDLKNENNIYVVDFGLASKCTQRTEYKLDPRNAHNGTIEYTSRDAHMGLPTMRGDFEILGYNVIQWLCGSLPWEKNLKIPSTVQREKEKAFDNISNFLKICFNNQIPTPVTEFMNLLALMNFKDVPNYAKFRLIFEKGLQKLGCSLTDKIDFGKSTKSQVVSLAPPAKVVNVPKKIKVPEAVASSSIRKSPRIKAKPPSFSLDESTVGIVLDKRREKLRDVRKILDAISDDSDTEYDIQLVKKSKKAEAVIPVKTIKPVTSRRAKPKPQPHKNLSISESEEIIPKGTRSRGRKVVRKKSVSSDEDMFADCM